MPKESGAVRRKLDKLFNTISTGSTYVKRIDGKLPFGVDESSVMKSPANGRELRFLTPFESNSSVKAVMEGDTLAVKMGTGVRLDKTELRAAQRRILKNAQKFRKGLPDEVEVFRAGKAAQEFEIMSAGQNEDFVRQFPGKMQRTTVPKNRIVGFMGRAGGISTIDSVPGEVLLRRSTFMKNMARKAGSKALRSMALAGTGVGALANVADAYSYGKGTGEFIKKSLQQRSVTDKLVQASTRSLKRKTGMMSGTGRKGF